MATNASTHDTPATRAVGSVAGFVYDSIARRPLADAAVQLVDADSTERFGQTVKSDSLGRFVFDSVPDGRYLLGFFHPMLDSLGIEAPVRGVSVQRRNGVRVNLAIPSAAHYRATICGPPSLANNGAIVMGFVRGAGDRLPRAGVTVAAEWIEFTIGRDGLAQRKPHITVSTTDAGYFAFCNVPSPGTVTLAAHHGADSTDVVELTIPPEGFLRHELFLGEAVRVTPAPAAPSAAAAVAASAPSASVANAPVTGVLAGTGRVGGVVTRVDGSPIADVQVVMLNGPQARTNSRGEWALTDTPTGTRMVEFRAVGHYPVRKAINVIDGVAPVRVTLPTLKAVLDTMKVSASRNAYSNFRSFEERRRIGQGRFVTATDIARRRPIVTSELLRSVQGVYLDHIMDGDTISAFASRPPGAAVTQESILDQRIVMRGLFAERCVPTIYLNDRRLENFTAGDLDALVRPPDIIGIEVYSPSTVPPRFQPAMSGCGSIVIWRK